MNELGNLSINHWKPVICPERIYHALSVQLWVVLKNKTDLLFKAFLSTDDVQSFLDRMKLCKEHMYVLRIRMTDR